ncbi:MAG: IPT/TIG domain-containing protein [Bryobacteraceae bacterium]
MSRNHSWPQGQIGRWKRTAGICVASWAILLPALARAQTYNISLIAGTLPNPPSTTPVAGFTGDSGQALNAELDAPTGIWVDSKHNIYIVDKDNDRIRMISTSSIISTVAGSSTAEVYAGDGGKATQASLNLPNGIAFDSAGNMYIADTGNNVVRKVNTSGIISTVAGNNASAFSGDGGPAIDASLSEPTSLAFDAAGNLYIADSNNNCIRIVTPDQNINTFAGQCSYALFEGDGGPATKAKLNKPYSVAVDAYGNVFISDTENERVREVTPDGIINTIAGNGTAGFQDGPALQAEFYSPSGIALDASGNIYVADKTNTRIRKILPGGTVVTIAGNGSFGYSGNGVAATHASLYFPQGLGLDPSSSAVYIADTQNDVVRELTVSNASSLPSVKTGGAASAYEFGALASPAPGSWIEIYGSNLATGTQGWTTGDFNGNSAPTSLGGTDGTPGTVVTIGGQLAYIDYISPGQVNVQVPSTTPTGLQPIVVTSGTNVSPNPPQTITISATAPGLYAPSQLLIGGNQYVGALFSNSDTWVLPPNAVTGFTSQRAKPGDYITLYGIGFGPVVTNLPAGQIAQGTNNTLLAGSFQISFGGTPATVSYAGLAPDSVGLYQFNVVVPNVAANDLTPITFTLGGVAGTQTLYTAIGN